MNFKFKFTALEREKGTPKGGGNFNPKGKRFGVNLVLGGFF